MAQNCYNERGQETSFLLKGSQSRTRWWTWHDFMMTEGAFLITINILSRPAIILCSFSLFFFLSRMTASLCLWLYGSPLLGKVSGLISDIRLLNTVACLSWSIVLIRFHGLHLDKFIWDVGNCISELHFIIKLCWNNYFLHLWKSLMNTELGFVFFFQVCFSTEMSFEISVSLLPWIRFMSFLMTFLPCIFFMGVHC